nr:hypothetical protein [Candidatus Mycoplasma haematolamae]
MLLFGISSFTLAAAGLAIPTVRYEHNNLLWDPKSKKTKIFLKHESYLKLRPKLGSSFSYLVNNELRAQEVLSINTLKDHIELYLHSNDLDEYEPITPIKYRLESKPFWVNLFE